MMLQTARDHPLPPIAAILLVAAVSIPGCAKEQAITLRLANWADHVEGRIVDSELRRFEKLHPGVRVVQESIPAQYREKMLTTIAAGSAPDVFLLDSGDVPAFVNRNLLIDLAPYMDRVGFRPADYFPNVLAIAKRGDKLYAFPKDFTPMVVYYNRALLRANGVATPQSGWTWDDFIAKCLALRKDRDGDGRVDQFGIFFPRPFFYWQPFIWLNGSDILSPDGSHTRGYLDSPTTLATLRFLLDWHQRWDFTPPLDIQRNPTGKQRNLFFLGRIGFYISGHWSLPGMRKYIDKGQIDIGVVGLPRVPGKPYVNIMYESGWCVPVSTHHRKYAIMLAAYMAGAEAQRSTGQRGLAIPAMRAIADEIAAADTTGKEKVFLEEVEFARQPWGTRIEDFTTLTDILPEIFDRVIWGNEDLQKVTEEVTTKLDALLAEQRLRRTGS